MSRCSNSHYGKSKAKALPKVAKCGGFINPKSSFSEKFR
jgi:hypothetical protein